MVTPPAVKGCLPKSTLITNPLKFSAMGKITRGVLGGFSGRVGNIIGASWKGIDYMRIMPASVTNVKSEGQMNQRSKFILVLRFLQTMTSFIRVGYRLYAVKMTQFNNAMSYLLRHAIDGASPDFFIDYSRVLVSRGSLTGVAEVEIASQNNTVIVTWNDNSGNGSARSTDKALIVLYNADKEESVFTTDGALRSAGEQVVNVPPVFEGDTVHVYLGFISQDGNSISNSVYAGDIVVEN
jgi:hypothetical protein